MSTATKHNLGEAITDNVIKAHNYHRERMDKARVSMEEWLTRLTDRQDRRDILDRAMNKHIHTCRSNNEDVITPYTELCVQPSYYSYWMHNDALKQLGGITILQDMHEDGSNYWINSQTISNMIGGETYAISTIFRWIWSATYLGIIDQYRLDHIKNAIQAREQAYQQH